MTMASLSASLLARKGHASPAVRPAEPARQAKIQEMFPPKRPQIVPAPTVQKAKSATPGKRARKTLRLDGAKNRQLRLLAAHLGVSQQTLMEKAVSALLDKELDQDGCVCGNHRNQHKA